MSISNYVINSVKYWNGFGECDQLELLLLANLCFCIYVVVEQIK